MEKITTTIALGCCLLTIGGGAVKAQGIGPSTLNSAGAAAVLGGNTYEWSLGEMPLVSTGSGAGIIVTQGLLQPSESTTGIAIALIREQELSVFPVPATTLLTIRPRFTYGGILRLSLLDVTGRSLFADNIILASGQEQQQLNIDHYATGNYILNVSYEVKGELQQRSYKIQKIQ